MEVMGDKSAIPEEDTTKSNEDTNGNGRQSRASRVFWLLEKEWHNGVEKIIVSRSDVDGATARTPIVFVEQQETVMPRPGGHGDRALGVWGRRMGQ